MSKHRYTVWKEKAGDRWAALRKTETSAREIAYFSEKPTQEQIRASEYTPAPEAAWVLLHWNVIGGFGAELDQGRTLEALSQRVEAVLTQGQRAELADDGFTVADLLEEAMRRSLSARAELN